MRVMMLFAVAAMFYVTGCSQSKDAAQAGSNAGKYVGDEASVFMVSMADSVDALAVKLEKADNGVEATAVLRETTVELKQLVKKAEEINKRNPGAEDDDRYAAEEKVLTNSLEKMGRIMGVSAVKYSDDKEFMAALTELSTIMEKE